MDVARPYTAICPTLDSAVLTILAGTTRPLTGREVARLAGRRSHAGVLKVLSRLVAHGLVDRQEAATALLYTLNRDHLAAPAVDIIAGMRGELLRRLCEAVATWEVVPIHLSLFGSTARGQGDTDSDVDLFVVRPNGVDEDDSRWRAQVDRLATQVLRWTGNHAGIAEVAEAEVGDLRSDGRPIATELRSDAVVLCGPDVSMLLGSAR